MGSGASGLLGEVPGTDLRLPASGLRFSLHQLRALNSYIDILYEEDQKGRITTETECIVEGIVQNIVDGAGQRDPRFRCCHLIALHRNKKMRSRSLEYLVTLDGLPTLNGESAHCRLQEGPAGYGKILLTGREADKWAEFLTPTGYLCRDKVVERWVQLLARGARGRGGGASRVLSARAAAFARPQRYCYLETVSQQRRCERLAIVEGAAWVVVRVGAAQAEAKLVLSARAAGCSPHLARLPLTHPLALLHYTAAQEGYYAAAVGPPGGVGGGAGCAGGERGALWQLRQPALEAALDTHCSDLSTVARVAGALNALIDNMREGSYQGSTRLLSRYMSWCALRRRLHRAAQLHSVAARSLAAAHASHHLLLVLDSLLQVCCRGGQAGFLFPAQRGELARRGARDDDWATDASCIRSCLLHLHKLAVGEEIQRTPSESLEAALFSRWESVNKESRSSLAASSCSPRQLRYLTRVARELISCKNMMPYENGNTFKENLIQATSQHQESIEELVHVLAILLDQARDSYLYNILNRNGGEFDKELSAYRSKKWNKLRDYYDASSACLINAARRDPELRKEDLSDINLMKHVLLWLHKGVKEDKKYLGPVLKPYLDALFDVSIENCWFLEEFDARKCEVEHQGLEEYCLGVHSGEIEPCMGLLDAAKTMSWAKAMVDFVDRFRHVEFRLVFPTGEGVAMSCPLRLPSRREHSSARALTLNRRDKAHAKVKLTTRCVLAAFHSALLGDRGSKSRTMRRHESSEEILRSVKSGNFWRSSTKPDIIPSSSVQDMSTLDNLSKVRRSRRSRPASYGFPEISITDQSDKKTLRRKYHTLKNLVYTEPVESIKELKRRPRSAGSTVRSKEALSRPSLLETLDFINGVKDALYEESGTSEAEECGWSYEEECLLSSRSPANLLAALSAPELLHLALGDLVSGLLQRGRFTILQELCPYLCGGGEGALFALHRLARAARSRSTERATSNWKLPESAEEARQSVQRYRRRPPDDVSGDEAAPQPPQPPQPPPLPRNINKTNKIPNHYPDYIPTKRLQDLENHLNYLEQVKSRLTLHQNSNYPQNYTGIINPIYDIKIPKDKFSVKRTKSLGRTFSSRHVGLEITRYNLTLGPKSGKKTNDVVTAMNGTSGETGLDVRSHFLQRYSTENVVGDSYRVSRITVD